MNLRSNQYDKKLADSGPCMPSSQEPSWVHVLPAAKGLWSMIRTFRERGNHQIANNLESAAERQAEVHLKTQQLMRDKNDASKNSSTRIELEKGKSCDKEIKSEASSTGSSTSKHNKSQVGTDLENSRTSSERDNSTKN